VLTAQLEAKDRQIDALNARLEEYSQRLFEAHALVREQSGLMKQLSAPRDSRPLLVAPRETPTLDRPSVARRVDDWLWKKFGSILAM